MKSKRIVFAGVLFVLIVLISWSYMYSKRKPCDAPITASVRRGEFAVCIEETGTLQALKSTPITSPIGHNQVKITKLVGEGTYIEEGEPVVWLDTAELEKSLRDAEESLKTAQANLAKAEENTRLKNFQNEMNVKSAESRLELTKMELESAKGSRDRAKRLYEAELVSRKTLEDEEMHLLRTQLTLETAEIAIQKAKATQKSAVVTNKLGLANSRTSVESAQHKVDTLKEQIGKTVIKAPNSGIVVYMKIWSGTGMRKIQEGDQLWRGQNILEIPDLSRMINIIQVDEVDISKVKEGQDVHITVDALPELELSGKVTKIATLAQERQEKGQSYISAMLGLGKSSGVKKFEVTIELDGTPEGIKPGMTTKTVVNVSELKDVSYVPLEAVFDCKGKKVAYVLDGSRLEERELVLGESNNNCVIVKEGLNPGEQVVLLDPAKKIEKLGIKQDEGIPSIPELKPDNAGKD